jgi:rhamnosyl/mannosyltransferase
METHLRFLCPELRRSMDVEVIVANDTNRTAYDCVDGVPVTRLGRVATLASAPITPGLRRRIRDARADIVHVHLPHPTAILSHLASGHRGPLVVTYHSDVVRQRVLGKAFEPVLHHFLGRAAAIICTSPNYIESSPILGAHRDRCHVLPFGIAVDQFRASNAAAVQGIRQRYGPAIILAVGRLIYYKGLRYLIEAMRDIPGHLLIIGEGPLRGELEADAARHRVADRVTFLGQVPDAVPYFQAADVFALPSIARSEAFGLVQLEAMACGKPVVNTRLASGVPYVSIDGDTGVTVPPRDAAALGDAITALLADPVRRGALGAAARRRVEGHFTIGAMASATIELYERVLAADHAR